ncbi:MAG: hypothetical protein ABSB19_02450 [Methylomonas sp.]|jgi:hypothetical protein
MFRKIALISILFILPIAGHAMTKCVVNGKTLYKKGICTQGVSQPINRGSLNTLPIGK